MAVAAERDLTIRESFGYEFTIQPASLFDNEQFMRKASKYKLGQNLKNRVTSRDMDNNRNSGVVVDGVWLIHQMTWQAGNIFSEIAQAYIDFLKRLACGIKCFKIFDGYNNSPKDHEHNRRTKNCNGVIQIILYPRKTCTVSKDKFLSCSANKEQFITLLCNLANGERVRMETFIPHNDCDTLIVKKAIELSETMSVEVVAEDTGILVMLLHRVTRAPRDILLRTKGDIYNIQKMML